MENQRIHIVGGAGAGKTTLANAYAQKLGVSYSEIDQLFWSDVDNRTKRPQMERDTLLQQITNTESWVVEGVFYKWLSPSFERADKIVVLDTPRWLRHYRIIKRAVALLISDPASFRIIAANLREVLVFNHSYDEVHLKPTLEMLENYSEKLVICKSHREAMAALAL